MAICRFCKRKFQSDQSVKSHLKWCARYRIEKTKKSAPSESLPKGAATPVAAPPVHAIPPVGAPDLSAPLREFMKVMSEAATKQHTPQTPQQRRRGICQAAKAEVIDRYRPSSGTVTASMRGSAKMLIEREVVSLPLDELPFEEVCELASGIRDRCYDPALTRQAQETERQRVEQEKRHKDEVGALGALIRADRRKKSFMQQANHQAHARCESKTIRGWEHLRILSDIETSLEEFLTGSESILDAYAIIQKVLDARFVEAEATLDAARVKAAEQWREEVAAALVLGAVVGLVVLALKYPAQTLAIFNWIERTFGYTPGADAGAPNPEAPKTAPPAPSAEAQPRSRRRRKDLVSPSNPEPLWGNSAGGAPGHA